MKRIGCLFEQVVSFENLYAAARKAFRGSKKYRSHAAHFYFHLEDELLTLEHELRSGTYQPSPYTTFLIYEPKQRQISASAFRDRVVHHAICNIIEPLLDRSLIFDSYACRIGKGSHAAIKRAQFFARRFPYFLKCDIRKHFESVDHALLLRMLGRKIKDPALLGLLATIIEHPVPGYAPGKGLPIGSLISQLCANLYLSELDHVVKERLRVKGYVRYMDDFLLFGQDKDELRNWLVHLRGVITARLMLQLKDEAQVMAPVAQGIPFLGFRIFPGLIRLDRKHLVRFRRKIRKLEQAYREGMIDETTLSRSVNSMIAHISHANTYQMRNVLFFSLA